MNIYWMFCFALSLTVIKGDVQYCESNVGKCLNVTVSGCPDSVAECILKRGTNVGVTIEFSVSQNIPKVKTVVHGILGGISIPFHVPNPDACQSCGLVCPLEEGKTYTYFEKLPIKKTYPKVSVDVKWQLEDGDGNVICCAIIPSRIN